jgi:hypothetical protein
MNKSRWLIGSITLIWLVTLVMHPVSLYSQREKRPLATFPTFSWEALVDGKLTLDIESAINDQFVGRSFWVDLKAMMEAWLGKQENNGILFGKEGTLFKKRLVLPDQASKNLRYLDEFLKLVNDLPVTAMLVPGSDAVMSDRLPQGIPQLDHADLLSRWSQAMNLIDLTPTFIESSETLYYRLDHHWNLNGAYLAYTVLCEQWGLTAFPLESFTVESVNGFKGTYANQGQPGSGDSEKLSFIDPDILDYQIGDQRFDRLIDREALKGSDKYAAFLHGNPGLATITVREAEVLRHLIVIKDSYANSLIPFFTAHFDRITVVDLRTFNGSLQALLNEGADQILYLQNFHQFVEDINVAKLRY